MEGLSNVTFVFSSVRILPPLLLPFRVVIRTTPFAAREPYRAAAFGPFSTFTVSTSSGLRSDMTLP